MVRLRRTLPLLLQLMSRCAPAASLTGLLLLMLARESHHWREPISSFIHSLMILLRRRSVEHDLDGRLKRRVPLTNK